MAFQLPNFQPPPVAVLANPDDPSRAEIVAYRALINQWNTNVLNQLAICNPQHGYAVAYPNDPPVNADQAARLAQLQEIRQYMDGLFPIYAAGYAALAQAIAAGNQPGPAVAAPHPRPPKTALPEKFAGKSTAVARYFLQQCENYAAICPFASPDQEIRWMLQLLEGDASHWANEQQAQYQQVPPPAHLGDRVLFVDEFKARWTDPFESEKALDRILKGHITQRTSVKIYNDQFNEALSLTTQTGTDAAILRSYETGLKPTVRNAAAVALIANPNINFHDRQMLMVRLDETLMQTRAQTNPTSQRRYVSTSPTSAPSIPGTATPAPSTPTSTPIKVEIARQYTRLVPEERERLKRIGACFRCRERGHMAHQCPRNSQTATIAAINPAAMPEPLPMNPGPTNVPSTSDF